MPTRVWWGITNPFKAHSEIPGLSPCRPGNVVFHVFLQFQSWLQGVGSHPNTPPASSLQLCADGGATSLELKPALNAVLWRSRQELSGLPVALSHHEKHHASNTIQLCRRNVSPPYAVYRLQAWLQSCSFPLTGMVMPPGPTGFLGWHKKSDSCNELLRRYISNWLQFLRGASSWLRILCRRIQCHQTWQHVENRDLSKSCHACSAELWL